MEYQFKKFEKKNVRIEKRITITKSNQMGFPTKFYEDNKIKDFKYVLLFWDERNRAIGVHFTNSEEEKGRFKIIHSKKGYGGSIIVRSFFLTHEIDPLKYKGKYNWEKYNIPETGEAFVIKLEKPNKEI